MDNNEKKAELHEALAFLVESANINDGKLTKDDIQKAVGDTIQEESQYELIYSFLSSKNIQIEGFTGNGDAFQSMEINSVEASDKDSGDIEPKDEHTEEQEKLVRLNLDAIREAVILDEKTEMDYLKELRQDSSNRDVLNILTESNMHFVPDICNEFKGKGVSYGDLIQEASLGVFEGIMTYDGELQIEAFHNHIQNAMRTAIKDAITEQNSSSRLGSHVTDLANQLDRVSVELSKDLDRTPTIQELASSLSISEDEVENVMKMSLNALNADSAN